MEILTALCIKCDAELGQFRNSWNGIGNSYHSPVYPPVSTRGLEATGDIYNGAKDSHIEHSLLQDIACVSCQNVVGLRCDSAPEGHLLKENQLILRLTAMSIVTEEDGQSAKISILKSYPLSIASGKMPSGSRRGGTVRPHARSSSGTPVRTPNDIISNTPRPDSRQSVPPPSLVKAEVTKFKLWAEGAISSQQKNIDRISGTVDRLEQSMKLFKDFMSEVRLELASVKQHSNSMYEEDLSVLRNDIVELRQQVEESEQVISKVSDEISDRHFTAIAQDAEQTGQKANEIEELKTELPKMRKRVEFLEGAKHSDDMRVAVPSRELRSTSGTHKRKQYQMDELRSPSESSQMGPPQKRRKLSLTTNGKSFRDPIIEIDSSEDDSYSPLRNRSHKQATRDTPSPAASALVLGESSRNNQPPTSIHTPSTTSGYSSIQRPGSSRVEVRIPYSAAYALSIQQQVIRVRDSNGVLLLPNGKVDKRSLRAKGAKAGTENTVPKVNNDGDNKEGGNEANKSFKCGGCKEEFGSLGDLDTHHSNSSGACSSADGDIVPRIFQCEKCKKVYSSYQGLGYHLKHSDCNPTPEPHASSMVPTKCNTCHRDLKNMFAFYAVSDRALHKLATETKG
ncbi:hypothetical protein VTL71DRAFT_13941 [Oculimacula yallundae]|uniref:C2H2-type domain-containing protein n=1 Tax=Oculimacula yallundae TaxID=86028 RepID=A0ABR4CM73_9HELO